MTPRAQPATARTEQLTCAQTPFDLNRVGTYHHHDGCTSMHAEQRPSRPGKERGGPLRFSDVLRLSSHTNKGPSAGNPYDHHCAECR
jgi:hypothetical protein